MSEQAPVALLVTPSVKANRPNCSPRRLNAMISRRSSSSARCVASLGSPAIWLGYVKAGEGAANAKSGATRKNATNEVEKGAIMKWVVQKTNKKVREREGFVKEE